MANYNRITTRDEFIEYCLRKLGAPVVEINVDDEQIEDRVNDAMQLFLEYDAEGSARIYLEIDITQAIVDRKFIDFDADTDAFLSNFNPENILSIVRVLPFSTSSSGTNFMDAQYQMRLNDIYDLQSGTGGIAYYEQMQQYMSLIDMKLSGTPQIQWNYSSKVLSIFGAIQSGDVKVGDTIMVEMYISNNPNVTPVVYNNIFLKEYATALIKEQWGQNLIKFEGMVLPGGVQLNGRQILEDAKQEIETVRQRIYNEYDTPPDFFVG